MNLKRGDRVLIRDDLSETERFFYERNHSVGVYKSILNLRGHVVTVREAHIGYPTLFKIEEDPEHWWVHTGIISCMESEMLYADVSESSLIELIGGL